MPSPPTTPYRPNPTDLTIPAEVAWRLGELIDSARADYQPRNFGERGLVDELALCQWRRFRAGIMQKAIYEHESTTFYPQAPLDAEGHTLEPHEDLFHMALAHETDRHAVVLAALSRLEARYYREFCTTLRLLAALRRGDALPLSPSPTSNPNPNPKPTEKENPKCDPSSISSLSTQ